MVAITLLFVIALTSFSNANWYAKRGYADVANVLWWIGLVIAILAVVFIFVIGGMYAFFPLFIHNLSNKIA